MRPVKLTMTAFGVYAKTTVIDFDKLGTQGLYLITGDTGAGKSTIFDAVSFALFGEPSGEFREPEMFRSRYANSDARTEVELVFDYRGKRCKITRSLAYERKKQRGEGTIKEAGKAKLELPGGEKPVEKDVTAAVESLLGINQSQFRQIVMLAQGDFRRMLFAKTKDRQDIFRRIFDTGLYEKFEKMIAEKKDIAEKNFEFKRKTVIDKINGIQSGENGTLAELKQSVINSGLPNISTLNDLCNLLKERNDTDNEQKSSFAAEFKDIDQRHSALVAEISKYNERNASYKELEKLRNQLPEFEKLAEEKKKLALNIESENLSKIKEINKHITLLENSLSEYKKLEEIRAELSALERQLARNTAERGDLEEQRGKLSDEIDSLRTENEALKNAGANLAVLTAERDKLEIRKKDISALLAAVFELDKKEKELADLQEKYLAARKEAERRNREAKELRRSFNDEQAGIIAESLTEGEPCPVCGSLHHPKKAVKSQNAPAQAEVETAEAVAETAVGIANDASSKSGAAQGEFNAAKKAVLDSVEKLGLKCGLENSKETAKAELGSIDAELKSKEIEIKAERENNARKEKLEKEIPEKTAALDDLNGRFTELEKQIAADRSAAREKTNQITVQSAGLEYGSAAEAQIKIDDHRARSEALEKSVKTANAAAERYTVKLKETAAAVQTLSSQLPDNYELVDTDEKTARLSELDSERARILENSRAVEFRLNTNTDILKTISDSIPELNKLEDERGVLTALSDIANGKTKNISKARLETFVQMRYFREILDRANVHFRRMTNDQYEFVRKKIPDNNTGDHTLDLDIKDHYNGTVRDVKSLSGGESFIASLSLALGLSETVQQNSGGIKLETMFVDEGFGSLDDETLRQAMNALTSLTESNRLIGIISHVDSVKREIAKKIIVTKDGANGSTARIEV